MSLFATQSLGSRRLEISGVCYKDSGPHIRLLSRFDE
jgi:hypothetical protein